MKFEDAYNKLIKYEGGYVNDPDDKGGETYKGIARNFHSNWEGWQVIDKLKTNPDYKKILNSPNFNLLDNATKKFYKEKFWDIFESDELPYEIAEEIFEIAVNTGIARATIIIQTTCNLLNRNQKLYSNISVDGKFGNITKYILNQCIDKNGTKLVFNVINILQGCFYIELMLKDEIKEKYIGWFNRIEIKR